MIAPEIVINHIKSFGLNYEYPTYFVNVDLVQDNELINHYENKLKEGSVFEYNYANTDEKFGVTYHHYKLDPSIINLRIPPEICMPDQQYYNFKFTKGVTSMYFGDYLWVRDSNWDSLYKEKDKVILMK